MFLAGLHGSHICRCGPPRCVDSLQVGSPTSVEDASALVRGANIGPSVEPSGKKRSWTFFLTLRSASCHMVSTCWRKRLPNSMRTLMCGSQSVGVAAANLASMRRTFDSYSSNICLARWSGTTPSATFWARVSCCFSIRSRSMESSSDLARKCKRSFSQNAVRSDIPSSDKSYEDRACWSLSKNCSSTKSRGRLTRGQWRHR